MVGRSCSLFPFDVALDPFGAVALSGNFKGALDFGAGPIVSQAEEDVIVARLVP